MNGAFKAVQVTDRVYWVGAVDWTIRNFHGYQTSRGTTYNAFLIVGDEVTLVDTVKLPFMDEMMSRIASVVDPSKIKNIVSNHSEMDHSGCLPRLVHIVKPDRIIASAQGKKALDNHFHWDIDVEVAPNAGELQLGDATLRFAETRMIHWPDSMFAYLEGDKVLFSNDAFGMHLSSSERFADELNPVILNEEAAKYYANILVPFSSLIDKLLAELPSLNFDVEVIAPDHGPIWRERIGDIIGSYAKWTKQLPTRKAVVMYDTMWSSTDKMARAIGDGLMDEGIHTILMPLSACHRSDVATELLDAGALVVGSPTMNNQMFPPVADAMTYLKGLRPRHLVSASFGSYGWSGEAVKDLDTMLNDMKLTVVQEGLRVRYVPDGEALADCRNLGINVAGKLKELLTDVG